MTGSMLAGTDEKRREVARLQQENAVLRAEAQRAQLQQRVQLIEQLRAGQTLPVQLLDHISRSLPDMLWLTSMQQEGVEVEIRRAPSTPSRSGGVIHPSAMAPADRASPMMSSKIKSAPCWRQRSARAGRNPFGGTITPPRPISPQTWSWP